MSSKKSTRNRSHSRKRSKSRGRASSKGGSMRKRSTSRGKGHTRKSSRGKLKKSIVRRHYRGGAENTFTKNKLSQSINGDVDIIVVQDTFLIVSNYTTKVIEYYSIEDDPKNDTGSSYVYKNQINTGDPLLGTEAEISNVAFQEIKTKEGTKSFLFYFIGNMLMCLEVKLKHNKECVILKSKLNKYQDKIELGKKCIAFYYNDKTKTNNLCYTILKNDELYFHEIALKFNENSKIFEEYSISTLKGFGYTDKLYSFCFISNNIIAFLISNVTKKLELPEIDEKDLNKYPNLNNNDKAVIMANNKRYFSSNETYKLKYYQYQLSSLDSESLKKLVSYIVFNSPRYVEIQDTNATTQDPKGMVYYNECVYINFNNIIFKLRIPPECIFNHYSIMEKLNSLSGGTVDWKAFVFSYFDRIEFVKKVKEYNEKNAGTKERMREIYYTRAKNAKRESADIQVKEIEDKLKINASDEDQGELGNIIKDLKEKKRIKELKETGRKTKEAEKEAERKRDEDERIKKAEEKKAAEKKAAEEKLMEEDYNANTLQKPKRFGFFGGDEDQEILEQAKKLLEERKNSWGSKFTNTFKGDVVKDRSKYYEPTEEEIKSEELKYEVEKGMEMTKDEGQKTLGNMIMNRYKIEFNANKDLNLKYDEKSWKLYRDRYKNRAINTYDYDFLYFDKSVIDIEGSAMGLTIYDNSILTINGEDILQIQLK